MGTGMKRESYYAVGCASLLAKTFEDGITLRGHAAIKSLLKSAFIFDETKISPEGPAQKEMAAKADASTAKVKTTTRKTNR